MQVCLQPVLPIPFFFLPNCCLYLCLYSLYRCHKLPDCIGKENCVISLSLLSLAFSLSKKCSLSMIIYTKPMSLFNMVYIKPTPPVHLLLRNRTQIGKKTYKNSIESTRKCGSLYSLDNSFPSHPPSGVARNGYTNAKTRESIVALGTTTCIV